MLLGRKRQPSCPNLDFTKLSYSYVCESTGHNLSSPTSAKVSSYCKHFRKIDVENMLHMTKPGKSGGTDGVHSLVFKECASLLSHLYDLLTW